jgi:hypothetical protein
MPIPCLYFAGKQKEMRNTLLCCALVLFLLGCGSADKTAPNLNGKSNSTAPPSLESFADSLVRLDKYSLESIDIAADYYKRLVPQDSSLADSAAVLVLRHINTVTDSANQKLFLDTTDYSNLIYDQDQAAPPAQKQFQQRLLNNHLLLQGDGEGGVYIVPDYDWINSFILAKTSAAVDQYLLLLANEEKNPTLLDAGLAIEASELADRLVTTEGLLDKQMPANFKDDVQRKHRFYRGTLLFGSDNSPALEYNDISLTEQFSKGYEYLTGKYPSSKATQLIREWQTIVKTRNRAEIEAWQKQYNPYE